MVSSSRFGSYSAAAPTVSRGQEVNRCHRNRSLTTRSASANRESGSPQWKVCFQGMLLGTDSWTRGASSSMVRSGSSTGSRGSYSTSMSSRASRAAYLSSAATATTGSPAYLTFPTARQ